MSGRIHILILSLLAALLPVPVRGQILEISGGSAYQFHLAGGSPNTSSVPPQFQSISEFPSIHQFFDNGSSLALGVSYRLEMSSLPTFVFSFEHERVTLTGNDPAAEFILGRTLAIRSYALSAGAGTRPRGLPSWFAYATFGAGYRTYQGHDSYSVYDVRENYDGTLFARLRGGVEFDRLFGSPFALGGAISFDFGSASRGEVDVFQNGQKVARALPSGDVSLEDRVISLLFRISYQIDLRGRQE
jgi:hypothetical protein